MEKKKQTTVSKAPPQNVHYQMEKDKEKVKGIFHFHEVPGGTLKFPLRLYPGESPTIYKLVDGEVCTIPLGVAKHLNSSGWYPVHAHAVNSDGASIYKMGQKKQRYSFQSLEFIDPADFATVDPGIITIENV